MTDAGASSGDLAAFRAALIDGLRDAHAVEVEILGSLSPDEFEAKAADGGWSPRDIQAHLSAWKQRQAVKMAAKREGRDAPPPPATVVDEINAIYHAERADWSWETVVADADAATNAFIDEVERADDATLLDPAFAGPIMGDGPEHTLAHIGPIAIRAGRPDMVEGLAARVTASIDGGGWPPRAAAYARYNLACFHALAGRLDAARSLLRIALPADASLRDLAPADDDLIALRDELPSLADG